MREGLGLALVVLGLLAGVLVVSTSVAGQQRVVNETLVEPGPSLISFDAVDTYVQEDAPSPPPQNRHQAPAVRLRGEDTGPDPSDPEDEGQRVHLLALSPSGGGGIPPAVRDRYAHGEIEEARLALPYEEGCNGALGTLTVRGIETRSWDPRSIVWNDTDLSTAQEPTVEVAEGPVLARGSAGTDQGNCTRMELSIPPSQAARLLQGDIGGLAVLWEASYPITLSTTSNVDGGGNGRGPRLFVELTTNAPDVQEVDLGEPPPRLTRPEQPLTFGSRIDRDGATSEGGVVFHISPAGEEEAGSSTDLVASRSEEGVWSAEFEAPSQQAMYNVTVQATDRHGWTSTLQASAGGSSLLVDDSKPSLNRSRLNGSSPASDVPTSQGEQLALSLTAEDLACRVGADPCLFWEMVWGPPGEDPRRVWEGKGHPDAEGNGSIASSLRMDRAGSWTARLTVRDPMGHENVTSWNLTVQDTSPPDAQPLADSMVGPDVTTNLQEGDAIHVGLRVLDDPPVDARLVLEPVRGDNEPETRELSTEDNGTLVQTNLSSPAVGEWHVILELDDGSNPPVERDWGTLRISPGQAPGIHITPAHRRIGTATSLSAALTDPRLDLNATRVEALVDGSPATPRVRLESTEDGGRASIEVPGISHGDELRLVVNATDETGHASELTASFDVDLRPPILLSPTNGTWHPPEATLSLDARDEGGGAPTIFVGAGETIEVQPPGELSARELLGSRGNGMHVIAFETVDDVGNRAVHKRSIGLDGQPPRITPSFDADGLRLNVSDEASDVSEIDAWASRAGGSPQPRSLARDGPNIHHVLGLGDLEEGDEVFLAVEATDAAGNTQRLGTTREPLRLVVPDRPPTISVNRASAGVGTEGVVSWSAEDPDGTYTEVTVRIVGPNGEASLLERQPPTGEHTIRADEAGRYVVEALAEEGRVSGQTSFFLSPDGRVTTHKPVPERISPGDRLELRLDAPQEPEDVLVWAEDAEGVQRPASVHVRPNGSIAANFSSLPEGHHELGAVVVHEPGASEEIDLGSVHVGSSTQAQVRQAAPLILAALAITGFIALAVVYVRRWREDEGGEKA